MGKENFKKQHLLSRLFLVVNRPEKLILCQPLGGLNDVLCQLYKCIRNAKKESRVLFIESSFNKFFQEPLSHAFLITTPSLEVVHVLPPTAAQCPPFVREILEIQTLEYESDRVKHDFSKWDYRRHIRHRASGGGLDSLKLTSEIELTEWSLQVIEACRKFFKDERYVVINVRNADYYLSDLDKIKQDLGQRILRLSQKVRFVILSDDLQLPEKLGIQEDPKFLDHRHIYHEISVEFGASLYIQPIVDLATLINAENVKVHPFLGFRYKYSGFSRLGKSLWIAKQLNSWRTATWAIINSSALSDFGNFFLDLVLGRIYFLWIAFSVRRSRLVSQLTF